MRTKIRLGLSKGEAGVGETIAAMRAVAHDAAESSPLVRGVAQRIKDDVIGEWHRLRDLYGFLRAKVRFTADAPGREQVRQPESMMRRICETGQAEGDCDDRATLAASILLAMGMPAYFIIMKREHSRPWHHVYYGSHLSAMPERVIPFDPQEGIPPGEWPPAAARRVYPV